MHLQRLTGLATLLLLALFSTHCAHQETAKDSVEALYAEAEESFKDERYLIAIEKYRDIKNRFPYSSRALDSELRIADCYFEQENYLEAEAAYEIFRELHPTHPRGDYVQYRIALSYFNQIPDVSSRDLSGAHKAIEEFQTLAHKFPSSQYSEKAQDYIRQARQKLAEHEEYVADFYYSRQHYLSASYRYAALLVEFPKMGFEEQGLFRLGVSYYHVRMYTNARDTLTKFLKDFPESTFRGEAESILGELNKRS